MAQPSEALGDPVPSRDGRRIALVSTGLGSTGPIIVRAIDGSSQTRLTAYRDVDVVDWSPDGTHLAIVSNIGGQRTITVAATDGSTRTNLQLHRQVAQIAYLPDGRIALVAAERPGDACPGDDPTSAPCALFVVNADGTGLDELVAADDFHGINTLSPSPDGTGLLWVEWGAGGNGRLHVFDLATHVDRRLADDAFPTPYEMNRAWF